MRSSTNSEAISGSSRTSSFSDLPHDNSSEPTISDPKPSPIHHDNQSGVKSCAPANRKLKLPIVALTSGAITAAHTIKFITSPRESSDLRQRAMRSNNQ